MKRTPIIPNRNIILTLPLEPDLQIMIIHQQLSKPLQQILAFVAREAVDVGNVCADGEDAAPARHGVGADDGVHGFEHRARVEGRAARLVVELETAALGGFVEVGLREGAGELRDEGLPEGGEAVVDFVARGPHCVCQVLLA